MNNEYKKKKESVNFISIEIIQHQCMREKNRSDWDHRGLKNRCKIITYK